MKQFRALPALTVSLLLVSCGGGSSSPSPSSSASGFVQQYTASATAGEVLTYTIDTNALTYSYKGSSPWRVGERDMQSIS